MSNECLTLPPARPVFFPLSLSVVVPIPIGFYLLDNLLRCYWGVAMVNRSFINFSFSAATAVSSGISNWSQSMSLTKAEVVVPLRSYGLSFMCLVLIILGEAFIYVSSTQRIWDMFFSLLRAPPRPIDVFMLKRFSYIYLIISCFL